MEKRKIEKRRGCPWPQLKIKRMKKTNLPGASSRENHPYSSLYLQHPGNDA